VEKVDRSLLKEINRNEYHADVPDLGWKFGRIEEFEVPGPGTFRLTDTTGWVTNYAQESGDAKITVFID